MSGGIYWSDLCVGSLAIGTTLLRDVVSSCLVQGYIRLFVVVVCVVGASWSRHSLLYSLAFVGLAVEGFLLFLELPAPFFSDLFPWASQVRLVVAVLGATLLEEGYPGWPPAPNVAEDLLCFLFFLLLQLATGSQEGLKTGLDKVCLSCPVSLSEISCFGTLNGSFRLVTIGSWAYGLRDELLTS